MINNSTDSILPASTDARVGTFVSLASFVSRALRIHHAFDMTVWGSSKVIWLAGTNSSIIANLANAV